MIWDGFKIDSAIAEQTDGLYGSSSWSLFQGDSRTVLDHLPAESVHCVVTSPPYYWQRDYGVDEQIGHEDSIGEYVENLRTVFQGIRRVLRKDGVAFLNIGDTYYSGKGRPHGDDEKHRARRFGLRAVDASGLGVPRKSLIGMPWRTALALIDDGWVLRSSIIWVRNSSIPEPTAKDRPWRKYEFIFMLSKARHYHFDRSRLAGEEDVWFIEPERNSTSRGTHFAPYPRELVKKCLDIGCPKGGVVLDPFVGGGTTMIEALVSGRDAVGVELSPEFCEHIKQTIRTLERDEVERASTEKRAVGE
jgi:DNA modification methylase